MNMELPNAVVKKTLDNIAKNCLKTSNYKQKIEQGSSKGDNYLGIIYRVHLEAEYNNDDDKNGNNNQNKISIIVKVPPQSEARRKQFFSRPTFVREALVYNEIIPMLLNFQKSKGVTDGFFHVPRSYATLTDENYEGIFLDDLREKGFIMFNRHDDLDIDHVRLVIRTLGKLHAVSLAIKDQDPEKLTKYKNLEDVFYRKQDDEQFEKFLENLQERCLQASSSLTDQKIKDKVEQFFSQDKFTKKMLKLVNGKEAEPYTVLCHGDCWNNNILYKYKDKKPVDICLIDWQITRYSSPVCDLMYYLFCCTTKEFRGNHYHDLMNLYHNELSDLLRRLGSNPEKIFPRNALDQQLKKFGSFGFLMAMLLLPFLISHADDVPDLDEMAEKLENGTNEGNEHFKSERTTSLYMDRIKGVIEDMAKLGYI